MNKTTIQEFKKEFDHWVAGGELMIYDFRAGIWLKFTSYPRFFDWTFSADIYKLVIVDDFLEYRKALVEGKTIEYFNNNVNRWDDKPEDIPFYLNIKYRIKPSEPTFKVGDWVYFKGNPTMLLSIDCSAGRVAGGTIANLERCKHWKPTKGKYCVFYNSSCPERFAVRKFHSFSVTLAAIDNTGASWECCVPTKFIDTLE